LTTICQFSSGPKAGTTFDFKPFGVQPIPSGSPCTDGQGSNGVAVAPSGSAGTTGASPPSPSLTAPNDLPAVLKALAWPVVSIVAVIALFLIARQAIAGGRNVEISWKVTEKVTGRVVITKVRTQANKRRVAA
jgi:hypothetical protein